MSRKKEMMNQKKSQKLSTAFLSNASEPDSAHYRVEANVP